MRPLVLVILDGWGVNESTTGNAIAHANTPTFDRLMKEHPFTVLDAAGTALGLLEDQVGGSEIGHLHIGAGRVIYKEQARINADISNGKFFENRVLNEAVENVKKHDSAVHLVGCLSDAGVHSHIDHLFALLELARKKGVKKVFIHPFLDGRDTLPKNARKYVDALEKKIVELELGRIATLSGRYYGMDRDSQWHRIKEMFDAMVHAKGQKAGSALEALEKAYERGETDEFVKPSVIVDKNGPIATIKDNDAIIYFNYRADRARELTHAFVDKVFRHFDRGKKLDVHFVCMAEFDRNFSLPVAYSPLLIENTLGEYLAKQGMKQLRVAETEKYAHVTFFLNCGIEDPHPGEDRRLIPSPREAGTNAPFALSSEAITDVVLEELKTGRFDVVIVNFADPDVAGHSGRFEDCIHVAETIDGCLARLTKAVGSMDGALLVTGDHGNIEQMVDPGTGGRHTAHTVNPVPFILFSGRKFEIRKGSLADVAPTILELLGLEKPKEMTGSSLILRKA